MTEIQGGRWDNVLRRLFPVKGTTIASQLAPEIVPTMSVQDCDPDLLWLRGERLLFCGTQIGPVAAQFSQINLRNDSTDRLVIVERIYVAAAAATLSIGPGNTAVGNAVTVYGRDQRAGRVITAGSVAGVVRASTLGAALSNNGLLVLTTAVVYFLEIELPIILPPSGALFVCDTAANSQIFVSFAWRERPVEGAEL